MWIQLRRVLRLAFPRLMHARALSHRWWSEIEEDLLSAVVPPNRCAVDVGAHVGSYTVALSGLSRRVFAFEPDQEMYALLRRAAPANVEVSNHALSDTSGVRAFRVPVADGQRMATLGSLADTALGDTEVRQVVTSVLDRLADVDAGFVKIDVEGHEPEVLAGGRVLMERQRPVVLAEANDPDSLARLVQFFAPLDYVGFFVLDGVTHPMTDFRPSLQDRSELERPVPRRAMRFVNNFFFVPRADHGDLRQRVDAALRVLSPRPGLPGGAAAV
jgi:FkbM family methyltransferase